MTAHSIRVILWLFAAMAAAGSALAAERGTVGTAERVQAGAVATHEGSERDLVAGNPILFDDTLKTGPGARLLVKLDDGAALTLGENASIHIDSFVYRPAAGTGRLALDVVEGAFLFIGGGIEDMNDSEVSIATPVATIGIRGTTVWGGPIDDGYGVLVLSGKVTVTTDVGAVMLEAGNATMIDGSGSAPQPPTGWDDATTARAMASITFAE